MSASDWAGWIALLLTVGQLVHAWWRHRRTRPADIAPQLRPLLHELEAELADTATVHASNPGRVTRLRYFAQVTRDKRLAAACRAAADAVELVPEPEVRVYPTDGPWAEAYVDLDREHERLTGAAAQRVREALAVLAQIERRVP